MRNLAQEAEDELKGQLAQRTAERDAEKARADGLQAKWDAREARRKRMAKLAGDWTTPEMFGEFIDILQEDIAEFKEGIAMEKARQEG